MNTTTAELSGFNEQLTRVHYQFQDNAHTPKNTKGHQIPE